MMRKLTEVEHVPHFGGPIRRFFLYPLCLASARLHQTKQKSLEYCSPKCACSFSGADFCSGKASAAGNTDVFSRLTTQHGRKSARKNRHGIDFCQLKLKSRAGESLAEVLVAMLIVAFATMLLVVMISAAASMDTAARKADKTFYADLSSAETHTRAGEDAASGTVIIKNGAGLYQEVTVETFGGSGLTSYKKEVTAP